VNREVVVKSWLFTQGREKGRFEVSLLAAKYAFIPLYVLLSWAEYKLSLNVKIARRVISGGLSLFLFIGMCLLGGFFTNLCHLEFALNASLWLTVASLLETIILYVLFASALNLVSLIVVNTIDMHMILRDAFALAMKDNVDSWLARLLGHKLWAGENTYNLFKQLMDDSSKTARAKWLMVNFLKEEVEDVFDKRHAYALSSRKPWPVHKYSEFLSGNIEHASDIIWFLDASLFVGVILPTFYLYVIAIIGHLQWRYTVNIQFPGVVNEIDLLGCFGTKDVPDKDRFEAMLIPRMDFRVANWDSDSEMRMDTIRQCIFPSQINLGVEALNRSRKRRMRLRGRLAEHRIMQGYHEVIEKNMVLPHNEAFRRSNASKLRYICFTDSIKDDGSISSEKLKNAVTQAFIANKKKVESTVVSHCQHLKLANKILARIMGAGGDAGDDKGMMSQFFGYHQDILYLALKLFEYTCGGASHCKVLELLGDNIKLIRDKDVGVYDSKIVVESEDTSSNSSNPQEVDGQPGGSKDADNDSELNHMGPRTIRWQYYPPSDDHELMRRLPEFMPEADYSVLVDVIDNP